MDRDPGECVSKNGVLDGTTLLDHGPNYGEQRFLDKPMSSIHGQLMGKPQLTEVRALFNN